MGLFSGDSSSSTTSNAYDQRKVLSGGSVDSGGGNVTVLDNGAVGSALDLAGTAVSRTVDLGAFGINRAVDLSAFTTDKVTAFAGDALKTISGVNTASLNFGADALTGAFGAVDKSQTKAFNFAADALTGAYGFANSAAVQSANAQADALTTAQNALAGALSFGGKQTAVALDSLNQSANLVKDAYADAKGRGAMTDYILFAALGVAALVAWNATRN
jgi:hypothetical protein